MVRVRGGGGVYLLIILSLAPCPSVCLFEHVYLRLSVCSSISICLCLSVCLSSPLLLFLLQHLHLFSLTSLVSCSPKFSPLAILLVCCHARSRPLAILLVCCHARSRPLAILLVCCHAWSRPLAILLVCCHARSLVLWPFCWRVPTLSLSSSGHSAGVLPR